MSTATLDRTGILYRNSPTVGTGGAVKDSLTVLKSPYYVRKNKSTIRTAIAGGRDAQDAEEVYEGRWVDGLRAGWRLRVEGRIYRIVNWEELGRRERVLLYCRCVE